MVTAVTRELASFASGLRFEAIPSAVVEHIKKCLRDTIGCGLFGSTVPWATMVRQMVEEYGGKREATVWGSGLKAPPAFAALANSIAVNAFEIDDTHLAGVLHPGCVVIASALPVAEREGVNGKDFLTAVVAGYECFIRVCLGIGQSHIVSVGRYTPSVGGVIGAAIAVGKLVGLTEEEFAYNMHIAAAQACGLFSRTMVKRFCNAKAAESGVMAALLAKRGFSGIDNVIEAEHGGFCVSFSDAPDIERVTWNLGRDYQVLDVCFKPYSAGWPQFTTVDAIKEIRNRHSIDPDAVREIKVVTSTFTKVAGGAFYEQYDTNRAFHTIPYCAAVTLLEGDCFIDQFTDAKYKNRRIIDLARKVSVISNPEFDTEDRKWTAKVEIKLRDGKSYSAEVQWSKGSHKKPLTEEELRNKFNLLASKVLDVETANRLADGIENVEEINNVNILTQLLVS